MSDVSNKLISCEPNNEQLQVINEINRNIILFASAGTGKTYSIANRIKNIVQSKKAKPEEILCITFTVKACNEMIDDIRRVIKEQANSITIKTIHGFCLYLLRIEAKKNSDNYIEIDVCDEVDEQDLLIRLLAEYGTCWFLEDYLKKNLPGYSLEQLFSCDVTYSKSHGLMWVVNYNNDAMLLSSSTQTDIIENAQMNHKIQCPSCGTTYEEIKNECANCGYDFRRQLEPFVTSIIKKAPRKLCEIVSAIKHARFLNSIYSEDEATDWQKTINYLYDKAELVKLFTFYDYEIRAEMTDLQLLDFFKAYGGRFMHEYTLSLKKSNNMDYDDLVIEAALKLKESKVVDYWRKKYRYITIDEMQDTSILEFQTLSSLFEDNNAMMCGDFFQTIYEWRGTQPVLVLQKYIDGFKPKTYMFRENYRATKTLANASFGYLKNTYPNLIGIYCPPDLAIHSTITGDKIEHHVFNSMQSEAKYIFEYLSQHNAKEATSICIMARSNKYISQIADLLDEENKKQGQKKLSFFTVERNHAFYKNASVKDLLAFLRILINSTDSISMERIALNFIKNVGSKTIEQLHENNDIGVSITDYLNSDTYEYGDYYQQLIIASRNSSIIVYDTETTGLDISKDQIIQLAAIKYNDKGEPIDTFNKIAIPTVEISQGAKDIIPFDIEQAIREHGESTYKVLNEFSKFVRGSTLIGHNSSRYDSLLVKRQLKENRLAPLDIKAEYDTLTIAKLFYPKFENFKLSTICDKFGIINQEAHNAMGDVMATGNVLFHMLRESIVPTQSDRIKILKKHARKFEAFYEFKQRLMQLMEENDLPGLFETIINTCKLETIHNTKASMSAIRDIKDMVCDLKTENAREYAQEFITNSALSGSQMDGLIKKLHQIPIISVHQSKGCEFDTVILAGCDNYNFPSYAAVKQGNESEEKRVFYVAISRAKKKLIITNFITSDYHPRESSNYISNIPREYVTVVRHY